MLSFRDIGEAKGFIHKKGIDLVSFLIPDIEGRLRNVTLPADNFTEKIMKDGIGFDASNLGFATIEHSDMICKPDLSFGFEDPLDDSSRILYFFCNVFDVETVESFTQGQRNMIAKAIESLKKEGIADHVQILLELEFNIIDNLYCRITSREVAYKLESSEMANPPDGEEVYRLGSNRGYFRSEPNDHIFQIRNQIVQACKKLGINIKYHHHEVGCGQGEIEFKFMPVEFAADANVLVKHMSHRVARAQNKIISFLPKLIPGEAGNGMHCHIYLLKDGQNVFNDENGLYKLSSTALQFIGGILTHISSLAAFTNPTTNSYRRTTAGLEAPSKAVFAKGNRSAAIRIPAYVKDPAERRFEFRPMDATCNPYLAFTALLLAGLDGVRNQIDPTKAGFGPIETNLYHLPPEQLAKIPSIPASLEGTLDALENDNEYLQYDSVVPYELIKKWISVKRKDIEEMRKIPHPWEVARYYDL
jgi:glutamine synthetase